MRAKLKKEAECSVESHHQSHVKKPRITNNSKSIEAFSKVPPFHLVDSSTARKTARKPVKPADSETSISFEYMADSLPILDSKHLDIIHELDATECEYSRLHAEVESDFGNLDLTRNTEEKSSFLADFDMESTKLFLPCIAKSEERCPPLLFDLNLSSNTSCSFDFQHGGELSSPSNMLYEMSSGLDETENKKLKKMQAKLDRQMIACEKRLKKQRERDAKQALRTSNS